MCVGGTSFELFPSFPSEGFHCQFALLDQIQSRVSAPVSPLNLTWKRKSHNPFLGLGNLAHSLGGS